MSEYSELLEKMKNWELDAGPDGWPAVQMKDITALCKMIEGAKILSRQQNRLLVCEFGSGCWIDETYYDDLETAFYEAGKKCSAEEKESKLPLSLLDSFIK